MSAIIMKGVGQDYDSPDGDGKITVLGNIDLTIEPGTLNPVLGPSGCGKSTLVRMMGGVRPYNVKTPTRGSVEVLGAPCAGPHDAVVTVFQHYTNLPQLTVRQNVALPFRLGLWSKIDEAERNKRIDWALEKVGLAHRQENLPSQLSGGQNQRVAIARALVLKPQIMLMDEPFGALDAQTRHEMQMLLVDLVKETGSTVMFITHDVEEALVLGDRVLVLSTRPAEIALDIPLPDPRPRDKVWLRTSRVEQLEQQILSVLSQTPG